MSRATVELDFFGREKEISAKSPFPKFHRQRSLLAISKMNPEILKSVIAFGSSSSSNQQNGRNQFDSKNSLSVPSTPKEDRSSVPVSPVYSPLPTPVLENATPAPTAPLTIFYNGTVVVFDVHQDKAETILKLAENGNCKSVEPTDQQRLVDGDLSISRKMSLQRFLEKRKERLTCASPYASKP